MRSSANFLFLFIYFSTIVSQAILSSRLVNAASLSSRWTQSALKPSGIITARIPARKSQRLIINAINSNNELHEEPKKVTSIFDIGLSHTASPEFPLAVQFKDSVPSLSNAQLIYSQRLFILKNAYQKWIKYGQILDWSVQDVALKTSQLEATKEIAKDHISPEILQVLKSKEKAVQQSQAQYQQALRNTQLASQELEKSEKNFKEYGEIVGLSETEEMRKSLEKSLKIPFSESNHPTNDNSQLEWWNDPKLFSDTNDGK